MINKVFLEGRLVRDCELKQSKGGNTYLQNCLAVSKGDEKVDFINVTFFGKSADLLSSWCGKGDLISLEGHVSISKDKDNHDQVGIVGDTVHFLSKAQGKVKTK